MASNKDQQNGTSKAAVSVDTLKHLLSEIDEDDIPLVDEEADFDYQRAARERKQQESDYKDPFATTTTTTTLLQPVPDDDVDEDIPSVPVDIQEPTSEPQAQSSILHSAKSIVKHEYLDFITKDMSHPFVLSQVGKASLLRCTSDIVAVGTERGLIMLYNVEQRKRTAIMGTLRDSADSGIVSMEFGPRETRMLVAAYARGDIVVWNLETFMPIKRVVPFTTSKLSAATILASTANTTVGSTASTILIAAVDMTGALKMYNVRKTMFSYAIDDTPMSYDKLSSIPSTVPVFEKKPTVGLFDEESSIAQTGAQNTALLEEDRVLEIKSLPPGEGAHASNLLAIAAITTQNCVTILVLSPAVARVAFIHNPSGTSNPPSIAWCRSELPNGEFNSVKEIPRARNPQLAVGWGNQLFLYRLVTDDTGSHIDVIRAMKVDVSFNIGSIVWISDHVLALIDIKHSLLSIVDPYAETRIEDSQSVTYEVETIPLGDKYDTKYSIDALHYNGLSELPKFKGIIRIVHPSSKVFLLGDGHVQTYSVKSWDERIQQWGDSGYYIKHALNYAISLYNGYGKAAVGVPAVTETRHQVVGEKISSLLNTYAKLEMKNKQSDDKSVYEQVGRTCIDYALQIHDMKIFWELYLSFKKDNHKDLFISLLEPFIIVKKNDTNSVAPIASLTSLYFGKGKDIMNTFIEYYEKNQKLDELEQCLIRLELKRARYIEENEEEEVWKEEMQSLFKKLVAICKPHLTPAHKMMRLYCYVYNSLGNNYITPLTEIVDQLRNEIKQSSSTKQLDSVSSATSILFEYMNNAYMGQSYSSVFSVPESEVVDVKRDLLNFIFKENSPQSNARTKTVEYPNLEVMLNANHVNFFAFLERCFNDNRSSSPWLVNSNSKVSFTLTRQSIAETLASYLIPFKNPVFSEENLNDELLKWKTPVMAEFFSFLIHFIATPERERDRDTKGDIGIIKIVPFVEIAKKNKDNASKEELEIVYRGIVYLSAASAAEEAKNNLAIDAKDMEAKKNASIEIKNKRQASIIKILSRYDKISDTNKSALLRYCEKYGFYKLAIFLHKITTKSHAEIIRFYLEDDTSRTEVFKYINSVDMRKSENLHEMRQAIMKESNLVKLLCANPEQFTKLIIEHFIDEHEEVMKILSSVNKSKHETKKLLFYYLEQIMISNEGTELETNESLSIQEASKKRKIFIDEELQYAYVELLCLFKPQDVFEFLRKHQTTKLDEILQRCEEIIKKNANSVDPDQIKVNEKIEEAICFLYERNGEVMRAIDKVMKKLEDKRAKLRVRLQAESVNLDPTNSAFTAFKDYAAKVSMEKKEMNPTILTFPLPKIANVNVEDLPEAKNVKIELKKAIGMCIQTSSRKTTEKPQDIWFTLLDAFLVTLRKLRFTSIGETSKGESADEVKLKDLKAVMLKMKARLDDDIAAANAHNAIKVSDRDSNFTKKAERNESKIKSSQKLFTTAKNNYDEFERVTKSRSNPYDQLSQLTNLWIQRLYMIYVRKIIYAMIRHVPVPIILSKVIESTLDDDFLQVKQVVFRLLKLYDFEHELLRNTNSILERDTFRLCKQFKKQLSCGIKPLSMKCSICSSFLNVKKKEQDNVRIFECGHAYHLVCISGISPNQCPLCPEKKTQVRRSKQKQEEEQVTTSSSTKRLQELENVLEEKSKMPLHKNLVLEFAKQSQKAHETQLGMYVISQLELTPSKRVPVHQVSDRARNKRRAEQSHIPSLVGNKAEINIGLLMKNEERD